MNRLALIAIFALILGLGVTLSKTAAQSAATSPDTRTREDAPSSPLPRAGSDKTAPGTARPSGAQVLPVPAPDPSTAAGQEKGNAALKAGQSPSAGGAEHRK